MSKLAYSCVSPLPQRLETLVWVVEGADKVGPYTF